MRLMIINAGWEQVDLIRKAKELGHYVIATDACEHAPGFRDADEKYTIEPRDIISQLKLAKDKRIDGVTADQCDYSYYTAAYIAHNLKLNGARFWTAQVCTNKKWMREVCERAGIRQPDFRAVRSFNDLYRAVRDIGFPAIIKPTDNRGGFGVTKADDWFQAKEAFYEAVANAHSRECLVEQYIEGTMTTVDGFACGEHVTLATASKVMLDGVKQVAMEIVYPAEFDLTEVNEQVIDTFGIDFGATHAEYIINDEGAWFIECANRGGGCFTSSRIVPAVTGFDVSEGLIKIALGEAVEIKKTKSEASVLRFFQLPPGKMKKVDITYNENILAFKMLYSEGEVIEPITNAANRHGFVITKGKTVREAREAAEQVRGCVE